MQFDEYLTLCNFKKKSVKEHLAKMKRLGTFSKEQVAQELKMVLSKCATATANKYINTYHLFAKYLIDEKVSTKENLAWVWELKHYQEKPKQRVIFSAWEMMRFFEYKDRYSMYFTLLARTGARPMEIASLKKADIDYTNNLLMIQESKTGKGRTVPIPDDVAHEFYPFLRSHLSNWCFPIKDHSEKHISLDSLRKAFKIRRAKLKLKKELTPYCFRHTFITRMVGANIPLFVLQNIVGHERADTTQKYYHNNLDLMREGMKKDPLIWCNLPPREKLKVVNDYVCKLGLDGDRDFKFERTGGSLSLSVIEKK
jgi:integrase